MLFKEEESKDWYLVFLNTQKLILMGDSAETALLHQIFFLKSEVITGSSPL